MLQCVQGGVKYKKQRTVSNEQNSRLSVGISLQLLPSVLQCLPITIIITPILPSRLSRNSQVYSLHFQSNRDVRVPSSAITHESVYDHVAVHGYE